MTSSALSALLAFIGYSLLNLGQGGQKLGLQLRSKHPAGGTALWAGATLATMLSFFFVFTAILVGSVAIAGAMAGTGLVSLAVFSRLVLGESLDRRGIFAMGTIIAAAFLIALFGRSSETVVRIFRLYALLGAGVILYGLAILLVGEGSLRGVLIGGLSGFLGAYSQLFQRYGTVGFSLDEGFSALILRLVKDPVTLFWLGLSGLSLIVLQFSYSRAAAIRIVPIFTANFILIPVLGGVVVFGEALTPLQWLGVALMAAGSVVLGRRPSAGTSK